MCKIHVIVKRFSRNLVVKQLLTSLNEVVLQTSSLTRIHNVVFQVLNAMPFMLSFRNNLIAKTVENIRVFLL